MVLDIDNSVLNDTTSCERTYACLKGKEHIYCKVKEIVVDKIHFISCLNKSYCNYKVDFGLSQVCSCPTRIEIFKKHKL
jgi:hypothetical protein